MALVISTAPAPTSTTQCDDVHIFLAKGNNEPYPGRQGVLAAQICADIPSSVSCSYENILYDNTLDDNYCDSVTQGDRNGVAQLTAYAASCPDAKLVLSGYSQGSNIIGDILGGGGGEFGKPTGCDIGVTAGISPYEAPGSQIVAAMVFGNNRHVANQSYNVLNGSIYSTDNPRYPDSLAAMNLFSAVLRDYCDESDPVCALEGPGPFVIAKHLNYFDRYTLDAAAWVAGKLGY